MEGRNEHGDIVTLEDNWRPPQPMHERKVKMSFVPEVEYEIIKEKKEEYKEVASTDDGDMASAISISVPITLLCLLIAQFIKH